MEANDLISILLNYNLISEKNASLAREKQKDTGLPPGRIVIDENYVRDVEIQKLIENQLNMNAPFELEDRFFGIAGITFARMKVNGDTFGVFELGEGKIAITVSDVAGKGIEAGLLGLRLGHMLKTEINLKNIVPATILKKINHASIEFFSSDRFATFIVFLLDLRNGTAEYSCAGSPPIFHYRYRDREVQELNNAGIPIGIDEHFPYTGRKLSMEKGDAVLFYTDGAYEAENMLGHFYGIERLKHDFANSSDRSAKDALKKLTSSIRRFTFPKGLSDDTTFVVIKQK